MKFASIPLAEAKGAVLAHGLKAGKLTLKKGHVLNDADIESLRGVGQLSVVAARLDRGEVGEDRAASEIGQALGGSGIRTASAFTGRVNFHATDAGLLVVDRDAVDRFNLVDESVTLATLAPYTMVAPDQLVATLKIIPFAVPRATIDACLGLRAALFSLARFRARRVGLIQTRLPGLKESVLDKTVETTRARLVALGSNLVEERRCPHTVAALGAAIAEMIKAGVELVLVAGASAIVDRRDVIPAAITAEGGTIEHFGMPVDPGNLMLVGGLGAVPVLGLPGCARSPKVNGFDWVLERLLADLPIGAAEIMRMGVGGLLADIPMRPAPRVKTNGERAVAGLILAAGQSRRMGTINKLLISIDGKPMVRHAVEAVQAARLSPIIVVTGHEREKVEAALAGLPVRFVFNPDYAEGLSTSLKSGLAALPASSLGALIALGDMPLVASSEIERLVAAFNPLEGRAIVVPTSRGKRGNPILWAREFFAEMQNVAGDVGARHLLGANSELLVEIEMAGDGVLTDIDTPQALAKLAALVKVET
ncbi:MAG TPA: molybdopterin-binding/glycosyltransferase family 2 protein [Stellaceae bacterium]|nr:molybdopterin-binding/glycosyltransferase family 2 protein [Stellaceae bacterium]